jgi:hypothetical protein
VSWVREAVLLENPIRQAGSYANGARVIALARAGHEAALVADRALEDGYLASAQALYREAALSFMAAAVEATPGATPAGDPLPRQSVLARFRERPWRVDGRVALEPFCASLAAEPAVGAAPARPDVEAAREVVRWLGTLVEARGLGELRVTRGVRVALAGVLALAALVWIVSAFTAGKNVALHKPVATSGLHPAAVSPPGGLTDGEIAGAAYGVHTKASDAPWVQVDLERVYAIDTIKVYNRGDGYFDEGLPMTLQLSQDGATFTDLETRTTTFGQSTPWVARAAGAKARFVRVRGAPGKYVTLSELEVYP